MDPQRLHDLLSQVQDGRLGTAEAAAALAELPYAQLDFARPDTHRALRTGFPEVIYCPGKTADQIAAILRKLAEHHDRVLATRCDATIAAIVCESLANPPDGEPNLEILYHPLPRLLTWGHLQAGPTVGTVTVFAGGTADLPVAEEAAITVEMAGVAVRRVWDVGVAGLHRLLDQRHQLVNTDVAIVVAGMEGALASVVGGLTDRPVIGVPTSVGYGTAFGGVAALLAMLNSCAAGVAVMNIDNGFGAGHLAARIARQRAENRPTSPVAPA